MKKLMLMGLLLTGTTSVQLMAQTAKTRKTTLTDKSQVVYEVADDGRTKNGSFTIKNTENKELWLQGYYKDNKPTGTWTYFNSKFEPTLRYNYDQQKIVYINNDSFKDVNVKVEATDTTIAKGASIPIPLCSVDEFTSLVSGKLYVMYDNIHDELQATVTAHVDKEGHATYNVSYPASNGKLQSFKLALDTDQFKIDWIPSHYKNEPVDADFSLVITITPNDVERWHRFRWDI